MTPTEICNRLSEDSHGMNDDLPAFIELQRIAAEHDAVVEAFKCNDGTFTNLAYQYWCARVKETEDDRNAKS
jgi:hypothetical protein